MNKMDKPDADPNRVKAQLAENGLIPEDYGGDTVVMPVSAKTGEGVQELLDMVLLVAELQELKANPEGLAEGTVIEARQDPQRGPVATVLLHRGTLHVGDHIVVGDVYGRVRAMLDYKGDLLGSRAENAGFLIGSFRRAARFGYDCVRLAMRAKRANRRRSSPKIPSSARQLGTQPRFAGRSLHAAARTARSKNSTSSSKPMAKVRSKRFARAWKSWRTTKCA